MEDRRNGRAPHSSQEAGFYRKFLLQHYVVFILYGLENFFTLFLKGLLASGNLD